MKLKQTLAVMAIAASAAMTTTSVLAETPVADAFTSTEMASLFEQDAQPLQLAALSGEEMRTTQGAWGAWGATFGGLGGLSGYTIGALVSRGSWSWRNIVTSVRDNAEYGANNGPNNGSVFGTTFLRGFDTAAATGRNNSVTPR